MATRRLAVEIPSAPALKGIEEIIGGARRLQREVASVAESANDVGPALRRAGQDRGLREVASSADRAGDELNEMARGARKADAASKELSGTTGRLTGKIIGAAAAYISLSAAVAGGKVLLDAASSAVAYERGLRTATGSQAAAAESAAFLRSEVDRLGLNLRSSQQDFVSISAAARGTTLEGAQVQAIFSGVSEAAVALGLSTDQTSGALTAIEQIISKGKVSAEELRGQLGERLPGAFQIAARSIGVTTSELDSMLVSGSLMAEDFLPAFARQLQTEFGQAAEDASGQAEASFARVQTGIFELQREMGLGLRPEVGELAAEFASFANDNQELAKDVGEVLGGGLRLAAGGAKILASNIGILTIAASGFAAVRLPAALLAVDAGLNKLTASIAANPFGALLVGATVLGVTLNELAKRYVKNANREISDLTRSSRELASTWDDVTSAIESGNRALIEGSISRYRAELAPLKGELAQAESKIQDFRDRMAELSRTSGVSVEELHRLGTASGATAKILKEGMGESFEEVQKLTRGINEATKAKAETGAKAKQYEQILASLREGLKQATVVVDDTTNTVNDNTAAYDRNAKKLAEMLRIVSQGGRLHAALEESLSGISEIKIEPLALEILPVPPSDEAMGEVRRLTEAELKRLSVDHEREVRDQLIADWFEIGDAAIGALHSIDSEFAAMVANAIGGVMSIVDAIEQIREIQIQVSSGELSRGRGAVQGGIAGASIGGAVGSVGSIFGLGGNDYSQEGAAAGGIIGGAIAGFSSGAAAGPYGALIGAAIGLVLGAVVHKGVNDGTARLLQMEGELVAAITKDEGGLGAVVSSMGTAIGEVISGFEQNFGGEITSLADIVINTRDDIFQVITNGVRAQFETAEEAIEFAVLQVIENAEFEGFSERVQGALRSGGFDSTEELDAVVSLAQALDAAAMGAGALFEQEQQRAYQLNTLITLGAEHNLSLAEIVDLRNREIAATREQVLGQVESLLGVQRFDITARNATQSITDFNAGLDVQREQIERQILSREKERDAVLAHGAALNATEQSAKEASGSLEEVKDSFELISRHTAPELQREIDQLRQGLASIPSAIDEAQIANVFIATGAQAFSSVADLVRQIGFAEFGIAEERRLQTELYRLQLVTQYAALQNLIAASQGLFTVSEAVMNQLEGIVQYVLSDGFQLPNIQRPRPYTPPRAPALPPPIAPGPLVPIITDDDFLNPHRDRILQRGETDFETSVRHLLEGFEGQFEEAFARATANAETNGTSIEDEMTRFNDVLIPAFQEGFAEIFEGEISALVAAGDVGGLEALSQMLRDFPIDDLSTEMTSVRPVIGDLIAEIAEAIGGFEDASDSLDDVGGAASGAASAITGAAGQIQGAGQAAIDSQREWATLGDLFARVGAELPTELVMALAHAEFERTRMLAIQQLLLLQANDELRDFGVSIDELIGRLSDADFDTSTFNPNRPTAPPSAPPRSSSGVDDLARLRAEIADWEQGLDDQLLSPLDRELLQLSRRAEEMTTALQAAGASVADLARVEQLAARERAEILRAAHDEARSSLRSLAESIRGRTGADGGGASFAQAQQEFFSLRDRADAGDLEALRLLRDAGASYDSAITQFLGSAGGASGLRSELLADLDRLGADPRENPVVTRVAETNAILRDILGTLGGSASQRIQQETEIQARALAAAHQRTTSRLPRGVSGPDPFAAGGAGQADAQEYARRQREAVALQRQDVERRERVERVEGDQRAAMIVRLDSIQVSLENLAVELQATRGSAGRPT